MSFNWISILILAVASQYAVAQDLSPAQVAEREKAERRARALSEDPSRLTHVLMPLRGMLTQRDFEVLVARGQLTPEQEQFAKVHFAAYRDKWPDRFRDDRRDLYLRSAALAATTRVRSDELATLFEDARKLDQRLGAAEQQWFEAVRTILGEHQQNLWRRCLQARQRDCSLLVRRAFPGLTVDLSELDLDTSLDEATRFTPLDQDAWTEFWSSYDRNTTPLCDGYAKAYLSYSPQASEVHYQALDATGPEEAMELLEEAAKKRDRYIDIARRIHDRNYTFAMEAEDLLRPEDRRRWNALVHRLFYPDIYPLPFDIEPFLTEFLTRDDWTPEVREELSELASTTRFRVKQIESELLSSHLDWRTKSERLSTVFPAADAEHRERMAGLQRKRLHVVREAALSIEDMTQNWLRRSAQPSTSSIQQSSEHRRTRRSIKAALLIDKRRRR